MLFRSTSIITYSESLPETDREADRERDREPLTERDFDRDDLLLERETLRERLKKLKINHLLLA